MCRFEKPEFREEEFNSSSKRKQFPFDKEETRSVLVTDYNVTNLPQNVLVVKTINSYYLRVSTVRIIDRASQVLCFHVPQGHS